MKDILRNSLVNINIFASSLLLYEYSKRQKTPILPDLDIWPPCQRSSLRPSCPGRWRRWEGGWRGRGSRPRPPREHWSWGRSGRETPASPGLETGRSTINLWGALPRSGFGQSMETYEMRTKSPTKSYLLSRRWLGGYLLWRDASQSPCLVGDVGLVRNGEKLSREMYKMEFKYWDHHI